jgi:protein TonB
METKKTLGADLENKRTTFFLMGFAVVLSTFFVLMEWRSPIDDGMDLDWLNPVFIENEFSGDMEVPGNQDEQTFENPFQETNETEPEIVYEDYNVVDEILSVEEPVEKMHVQLHPDSSRKTVEDEKPVLPPTVHPEMDPEVYKQAEIMPQFIGGTTELIRYIYQNIQYPSVALKQRIQGRVWCSFIVEKDGLISEVRLEEGVYIFLDEEAIRVLTSMPAWKPGLIAGKEVRVKVYLPIVFKL